jgi:hypothetical protein
LALLVGCSEAATQLPELPSAAASTTPDQAASGAEAARGFRSVRG